MLNLKATLMLVLGAQLSYACAASEPEKIDLPVKQAVYIGGGIIKNGDVLVGLRCDGSSDALINFQTEVLKNVVKYDVRSIRLKIGIQWVDKRKDGQGNPPSLVVYPLLKEVKDYPVGSKARLKSGVDFSGTPLLKFPVSKAAARDRLTTSFPIENADDLLNILEKGVLLKLSFAGKSLIPQINFFTRKLPRTLHDLRMTLEVVYQNQTSKLKLGPEKRMKDGVYVTRRGADFYYDGRSIRFSGINVQLDSFHSYEDAAATVTRLQTMNVNAIRFWASGVPFYTPESVRGGRMAISEKGDGSNLDLHDYFIAQCQRAGFFIHNTSLGSHTPPMEDWPGNEVVLKKEAKNQNPMHLVNPAMVFLDDFYLNVRIKHIKMYLNRINPYTGQRYAEMPVFATWELANENHFVAHVLDGKFKKWPSVFKEKIGKLWNRYLKKKYRTTASLEQTWGHLNTGEALEKENIVTAPTFGELEKYPRRRALDFAEFVQERFISISRKLEKAARECAPVGVGINAAPIVHNTLADHWNLNAHYAMAQADFVSGGVYLSRYTMNPQLQYYPWRPMFSERPYFYWLNIMSVKNKPFLVYEHSFFRPWPYRAEWIPAMTLMGAGLGWDALYLYRMGARLENSRPLNISGTSIFEPPNTSHSGYCTGFLHFNDEVLMASLALSSQAFINGIRQNDENTVVSYGPEGYRDLKYRKHKDEARAGTFSHQLMENSLRSNLQFAFDPNQKEPLIIQGKIVDPKGDREKLTPSSELTWAPGEKYFSLDCVHSKIVVGDLRKGFQFKDAVKVGPVDKDFAFFGISSCDGKALVESDEIILAVVSKSVNTEFVFDPKKITVRPSGLGHINGIVNRGRAPVIVDRVKVEIAVPFRGRVMRCYNFAGYCYRETVVDGKISISDTESLYISVISKK